MSRFSAIAKKSWKISDTSRIYQNQSTIRQPTIVLPEKFSPQKSISKQSRIFASSKQRLRLSKISNPLTPSPVVIKSQSVQKMKISMVGQTLKDSFPPLQSPIKVSSDRPPQFASRQSYLLRSIQTQSPLMKRQSNIIPVRSQQSAVIAMGKIKMEFINFKAQVWRQLMEQKESISKIASEINKKLQSLKPFQSKFIQSNKTELKQQTGPVAIKPLQNLQESIKQTSIAFQKQSLVLQTIFEHKANQLFANQLESNPQALPPAISSLIGQNFPIDIKESQTPIFEPISHQTQIIEENNNMIYQDRVEDKGKTSLDRCNQIASTIGILSEINSSPINSKSKSIQKLAIEEYKQKLLAISKSNQHLRKDPIRHSTVTEQQSKLKGNYKLDKFYNAIQKLKEQVNQIRNINDLKQIRKLRILKTEQ